MKKLSAILLSFSILTSTMLSSAPAWAQAERSASDGETLDALAVPSGIEAPPAIVEDIGSDAQNLSDLNPADATSNLGPTEHIILDQRIVRKQSAALPIEPAQTATARDTKPQIQIADVLQAGQTQSVIAKDAKLDIAQSQRSRVPGQTVLARLSSFTKGLAARNPLPAIGDALRGVFDGVNIPSLAPALIPIPVRVPAQRGYGSRRGFAPAKIKSLPKPKLPKGVSVDPAPIVPDPSDLPSNMVSAFSIPDTEVINQFTDIPLEADANSEQSVEQALRKMIDDNSQYGVKSADLDLAYAHLTQAENQLPTWEVSFRQQHESAADGASASYLPVYGANATFIIHVEDGKPVIRGVHGRLFPNLTVNAVQKLSTTEMTNRIRARLHMPAAQAAETIAPPLERQIVYLEQPQNHGGLLHKITGIFIRRSKNGTSAKPGATTPLGAWHAVDIFRVNDIDPFVAVDIASGQVFLWDMRLGALKPGKPRSRKPAPNKQGDDGKAGGQLIGRAPRVDHDMTTPPNLPPTPLPYATVVLEGGREIAADADGKVSIGLPEGQSMDVTAKLDSKYLSIINKAGENITVKATLVSGKDGVVIVFNPPASASHQKKKSSRTRRAIDFAINSIYRTVSPSYKKKDNEHRKKAAEDDLTLAQVTTYIAAYQFMDFNKARGIGVKEGVWNAKYVINVNIDDHCNAYMDPADMSRNLFQAGDGCINTGTLPGVLKHESGHLIHYLIAGYAPGQAVEALGSILAGPSMGRSIMPYVDGGLSEGIGDMYAMYMENTPLIGEHFFDDPKQPYLRSGENTYQFSPQDEVHDQGLAWMGFAWKLRTLLTQALGDDAGIALAESLLFPHLYGYATAQDIPTAMNVIYLAATALTTAARDTAVKAVQDAAAAHGINIGPAKKRPGKAPKKIAEIFLPHPGFGVPTPAYA